MMEPKENHLKKTILKLEQLAAKILQTQGYNGEAEKILMLKELVREQTQAESEQQGEQ